MTRDNQELRDALVSAAFLLKWSSADLHKKAQDLADAGNQTEADAIREIVNNYQACESNLLSFVDEVKAGRINRESVEEPR
ncbi:hypothetical protein [Pseudomonas folii]|uniref:Uncharacterized protein n=1 Tax=Pseudomonas folii TaxID=2762593 RepID=A0ABR7AV80_9PSED|nr:hypothetical protein [Pseudomonas folii]MBC3948822.1 hypothetical protein [Pseudomonas folii]